jgi:hypothetical protein
MDDHGLDIFVAIIQSIFLMMVIGPICYFIYIHGRERRTQAVSGRKQHGWNVLYVLTILLLIP